MERFDVTFIRNAVVLLLTPQNILEAVREAFLNTDYYISELRDAMVDQGVSSEYIDMFDCADPKVIFDKHVKVDTKDIAFNFGEAAESRNRDDCFFTAKCMFDIEGYVKMIDELNKEDSAIVPASDINGWLLTDDSCFQYARKLYSDADGNETWSFVQLEGTDSCYRVRGVSNVVLTDYSKEYIDSVIESYYNGGVKEVERVYKEDSQQIILECIFEQEQGDNCHFIAEVESEAEGYSTIKRWLSNGGLMFTSVNTLLERHKKDFSLKEKRALEFANPNEMYKFVIECGDIYNPCTGELVSKYNNDGCIIVINGISEKMARNFADKAKHCGYDSWISVIEKGGAVFAYHDDMPSCGALVYCRDEYALKGWIRADEHTFSKENEKFISKQWDYEPTQWIIGVSGSSMDDVVTKIVVGTTDMVKNYLLCEVNNTRADGEPEEWDGGTESVNDIMIHEDGKMYAYGMYRSAHFDYTATPIRVAEHIDLSTGNTIQGL